MHSGCKEFLASSPSYQPARSNSLSRSLQVWPGKTMGNSPQISKPFMPSGPPAVFCADSGTHLPRAARGGRWREKGKSRGTPTSWPRGSWPRTPSFSFPLCCPCPAHGAAVVQGLEYSGTQDRAAEGTITWPGPQAQRPSVLGTQSFRGGDWSAEGQLRHSFNKYSLTHGLARYPPAPE